MNIKGQKVKSIAFGIGTVIQHDNEYITVEFPGKTTRFVFPSAFERFLIASDAEVQAQINNMLKAQKQKEVEMRVAAENKRKEKVIHRQMTTMKGKKKNIDEMFTADYHVEHLTRQPILTYKQVEQQFGIKISGFGRGINPTPTGVVLISSMNKSGGKFVYHDKWTTDGDYLYSGEGKTGDQSMTKGNLAIKNAACDGKKLYLFVKLSPQEYYYQGIFELVNYQYEDEKDETGYSRKEYKFRLRKVK